MECKPGPLTKYTVLDFTWVLAGPHATKTLADLGARVLKVEPYKRGANERWLPLRVTNAGVTQSSYSINNNRGKKSFCINVKSPRGMAIVQELVKRSDVMVENFAPGVMERLGLDYESARQLKPDIVYCSISSFGHWGPYSNRPGYDIIAQAASGWSAQSDPQIIAPVSIADTNAAMHACTAILAALLHRENTGVGQNIDISMMDCLFSLHENTLPWYLIGEPLGQAKEPPKVGSKHPGYSPYGVYQGRNGSVAVALLTDSRWESLLDLMGEEFAWIRQDPRFASVSTRCTPENAPVFHEALEQWVMSQPSVEEAERLLQDAGVPALRVRGLVELATVDPQIKARQMLERVHQPFIGSMLMYGCPMKLSETPGGIRGHAPMLGEHNREVLEELLGLSSGEIDALYREGILYHEEAVDRLSAELGEADPAAGS